MSPFFENSTTGIAIAGLSPLAGGAGVPGVPWSPQILADQLTLSKQMGGADYAHQMILVPPDFQTRDDFVSRANCLTKLKPGK